MKNTLAKLPFYKGTSVMIIESSIGVTYGEANPFIQFKFAPRADYKSQGQWEDENCFWITTYTDLYNFVSGINAVASGKLEKYELKNPMKNVSVQIRASVNDTSKEEYVTFHFFRGSDVKIKTSLIKGSEFMALFSYFSNLLANYNSVCATALFRNDVYYTLFVKDKENKSSGNSEGGGKSYSSNNKKSGGNTKSAPPQQNNRQMESSMNSMENEINGMENGLGAGFSDDVPF